MTFYRRLDSAPVFMAIAILLGVALLVPRFLTPVVEAVGERIMENATGDLYDVNITALTVTVAGRVKAERISVRKRDDPERTDDAGEATDETGNTLGIIVHGLSIRYNVNRALEENPLSGLHHIFAEGVEVTLPVQDTETENPPTGTPLSGSRTTSFSDDDIKRIEMRLITALGLLPDDATISLPLDVKSARLPENVEGFHLSVASQRLHVTADFPPYSVTLTVLPGNGQAEVLIGGPGVTGGAALTRSATTATLSIFPPFDVPWRFQQATATGTITYEGEGPPLAAFWRTVQQARSGEVHQAVGTIAVSGVPTPFDVMVNEGFGNFEISRSMARINGRIDAGKTGRAAIRDASFPITNPAAIRLDEAFVHIPEGAELSRALFPERVVPPLMEARVVVAGKDDRFLAMPEIEATLIGSSSETIHARGRISRAETGSLGFEIGIDEPLDHISFSRIDLEWTYRDWTIRSAVNGTARLSALSASLQDRSTGEILPSGISLEGTFDLHRATSVGQSFEGEIVYSDRTISLRRLYARYSDRAIRLMAPATVRDASGGLTVDDARFALLDGTITVSGYASRDDFSARLSFDGLDTGTLQWRGHDISAVLTGNLTGEGTYDSPRVSGGITARPLSVANHSGSLHFNFVHAGEELAISDGEIIIDGIVRGNFAGGVPVSADLPFPSTVELHLAGEHLDRLVSVFSDLPVPSGAFSVNMTKKADSPELAVSGSVVTASSTGTAAGIIGFGFRRLDLSVTAAKSFDDGIEGSIHVSADDRNLLRGVGRLSVASKTWSMTGESEIPLEFFLPYLPPEIVAVTGSLQTAVTASGTFDNMFLDGTARITDGEVRSSRAFPPITALNATFRFGRNRVVSEEIRGELGLAPFTASFSGTIPGREEAGSFEMTLRGDNLLLATSPTIRARGNVNLRVLGGFEQGMNVDGTVVVQEATFRRDIPLIDFNASPRIDTEMLQLFSLSGPIGRTTTLDIRILANQSIRVENNLYSGPFSADLRLGGTLEIPQPQGRVFTSTGRLILPLTTLTIEQIVFRFPQDRPFSPRIEARGTTRLRDYRLSAVVTGELPDVEVDISSTPPLSQSDALVLLTTGFVPRELTGSSNRVAVALGSRLGTQFIQSLVGDAVGSEGSALTDRLEVVLGEGVTESGAETIEIEFRLSEEDSWFLVFRRDRYDRYNMDLAWRFWLD